VELVSIMVGITLGIFSLSILVYPFFKYKQSIAHSETHSETDLEFDLNAIYEAIKTLQLEHQLNRITEQDFMEQLNHYRFQAANLLRSKSLKSSNLENFGESSEFNSNLLEHEIMLARGLLSDETADPKI